MRICLSSLLWSQYRSYQVCFILFKIWMNLMTVMLFLRIFTSWHNYRSRFFQMKISWFSSLSMTDFSYQMTAWMWSMNSCRFWASSIIYFAVYSLSKAFNEFILNHLISSLHHIWISLSCCIAIFMTLLSSCIYHCRAISCKQLNKLILIKLSFQNSTTFYIWLQNKWMSQIRMFFSLKTMKVLLNYEKKSTKNILQLLKWQKTFFQFLHLMLMLNNFLILQKMFVIIIKIV